MEAKKYFNSTRLFYLLRRELVINYKLFLTDAAAVGGFLLLLLMSDSYVRGYLDYGPFVTTFYFFFFLGGAIFTSKIFGELQHPEKSYRYLTLPASTLEKLITKWLLSTLGFIVAAYLGVQLIAAIGGYLSATFFGFDFYMLPIDDTGFLTQAARYLVLHSVFFLGACTFRNHNFLKTLLALFVVGSVVSIFTGLIAYLIPGEDIMTNYSHLKNLEALNNSNFLQQLSQIIEIVQWYVLAPFFIVVSYFKIQERQV